jgi:hypothetical protein
MNDATIKKLEPLLLKTARNVTGRLGGDPELIGEARFQMSGGAPAPSHLKSKVRP